MVGKEETQNPVDLTDEIDPETLEQFSKILTKVMPTWKEAKPSPLPETSKSVPSLEAFLSDQLKEMKSEHRTLQEKLEAIRDILTPEQLTLLRSRKTAPAENLGLKNSEPQPAPPAPPEKPKKKAWL